MLRSQKIAIISDCLECVIYTSGIKYIRSNAWGIDCDAATRLSKAKKAFSLRLLLDAQLAEECTTGVDSLYELGNQLAKFSCSNRSSKCLTC